MVAEHRNPAIDAYFAALDAEDVDRLLPHLAPGFTYLHPDTVAEGAEGMRAFFADRAPQDTTHEIRRRLHADAATVVEGRLTGELADGTPREGDFCDVFDVDEEGRLVRVAVYPRL